MSEQKKKNSTKGFKQTLLSMGTPLLRSSSSIKNNKIAIMTLSGAYSCNPKYVYEELMRSGRDLDIVWLIPDEKLRKTYPEGANVLLASSKSGIQAAYSAKYWIDNGVLFSSRFEKKKEQIHIQLMHGSLGIKKLDNAIKSREKKGEEGLTVIRRETENTNFVITNSAFEEGVFRTIFWKNVPMLRLGHARTDILFDENEEKKAAIRKTLSKKYGISEDFRLAMYAPTHRKGVNKETLNLDFQLLCDSLEKKFGGKYVVMVRLHQRTKKVCFKNSEGLLYNVTDYPDMQELMYVTDVGITDYSSWIYDYVLARRPGFIYATDIDYYVDRTGFAYSLYETPFPVCKNNDEMKSAIEAFDNDDYQKKIDAFLADKECTDDGHAASRFAEWFFKLMDDEK